MSQIDASENILSETIEEQDGDTSLKLVPVAESIRYRKRAQSAERRNESLAERLAQEKTKTSELVEQLSNMQIEQKLMRKLVTAGAVDLEAAVLVAKARMEGSDEADLDSCVEQLKKEKQYLFAAERGETVVAKRTAPAKDRAANDGTILERAAKKAATTGNRTDLQEYLKLRRHFL